MVSFSTKGKGMRFCVAALLVACVWLSPLWAQSDSVGGGSAPDSAVDGVAAATMHASTPVALREGDSPCDSQTCADADRFSERQVKLIQTHKRLAFTTGGLVLAAGAIGGIHYLQMIRDGHIYRDSVGFTENKGIPADQSNGIKAVWGKDKEQALRVLHGATIASAVICYTATATIEIAMPRMSRRTDRLSPVNIHKGLFLTHAALMAANVVLGFAESYALSQGNHTMVQGLGAVHIGIGIAAPVVMFGSGLVYKLPI